MNLLDNELVRKYFGCAQCERGTLVCTSDCADAISRRVLEAMQTPIRKGERYLNITHATDWYMYDKQSIDIEGFHPHHLRLPDSFQKQEAKFDPEFAEKMLDFKWCGYDQKEMRSMRDFAISRGWKPEPPKCECASPLNHVHGCPGYVSPTVSFSKPKDLKCPICGRDSCWQHDAVEIKIKQICRLGIDALTGNSRMKPTMENHLRDLVKLARNEK